MKFGEFEINKPTLVALYYNVEYDFYGIYTSESFAENSSNHIRVTDWAILNFVPPPAADVDFLLTKMEKASDRATDREAYEINQARIKAYGVVARCKGLKAQLLGLPAPAAEINSDGSIEGIATEPPDSGEGVEEVPL